MILVKSECDFGKVRVLFCGVVLGVVCRGVRYNFYSMSKYSVFQCGICGKRVIPLPNMGYSSEGYGVFRRRIWGIPLLDRGISYGICYHWV